MLRESNSKVISSCSRQNAAACGSRRFWRLRRRLIGWRLGVLSSAFRVRHAASETSTSATALRALLQNTVTFLWS